jgi:hypothetical protein
MQRRWLKTHGCGEQVTEEAPNLAQEGTLGLNTPKLLEEKRARVMTSESEYSLRASHSASLWG